MEGQQEQRSCPECIVVVDDDASIRQLLVSALQREGYRVHEAQNGREALSVLRSGHTGLIIMDLMMPVLSGWEVLDERASDAQLSAVPVIIITASTGAGVEEAIEHRRCTLLSKPFELHALKALVRSCFSP